MGYFRELFRMLGYLIAGPLVFALVGLVGWTLVAIANRVNRRVGVRALNGERWAANTTALLGFVMAVIGMLLSSGIPWGWSFFAGALASSYWNAYFRMRSRRSLLDL